MWAIFGRKVRAGRIPPGERVYAIGDIHGRSDLLDRLLERIRLDRMGAPNRVTLVFLGDYVDRGADSRGVLARLVEISRKPNIKFLRGNHDQMLLDFLAKPSTYSVWGRFGGADTLLSYGIDPPATLDPDELFETRSHFMRVLPLADRSFLMGLRSSFEVGDYFFTHAEVRPGIPIENQTSHDMMWIRDGFLTSKVNHGRIVVHGHSPSSAPEQVSHRIGIDTEAYASGILTAVVLEGPSRRFLQT